MRARLHLFSFLSVYNDQGMVVPLLFLTLLSAPPPLHAVDLPDRPEGLLYGDWNETDRQLIQPLLTAHASATGEQIFLAQLPDSTLELAELARWWRIGEQGSAAGALIVRTGEEIRCWSSQDPCPSFKRRDLPGAVLEFLVLRDSPIVDEDIFHRASSHYGTSTPTAATHDSFYAWAFFWSSLLLCAGLAGFIVPRDVHYTSEGWFKVPTFQIWKSRSADGEGIDGAW